MAEEKIFAGSYRKAKFILESHSINGGRKTALHEYVNSDKQVVEDLGLKRRSIALDAIVTGGFDGANYYKDRDALLAALEKGGSGTLVHPFFGNLENYSAISYTLVETFSEFGVATFTIQFEYSSPEGAAPLKALGTVSEVIKAANDAKEAIEESMEQSFLADVIDTYLEAKDKLEKFEAKIEGVAKAINGVKNKVNAFKERLSTFSGKLVGLIGSAGALVKSISDLVTSMGEIFDAPLGALNAMIDMFDPEKTYKSGGLIVPGDVEQLLFPTRTRNRINDNEDIINATISALTLTQAYVYFAQTEFETLEELEAFDTILEAQYEKVVNSGLTASSEVVSAQTGVIAVKTEVLSREAKEAITTLRTVASLVIEETKTTLPNVIDVRIGVDTPLRVLEFRYYGNNNQTESLRLINQNPNESFIKGVIGISNNVDS